ncbi:MAG: serine protease, partial [Euryarchaeota archaeon]|nr:serine protease [Euryarchaeota archaeon]
MPSFSEILLEIQTELNNKNPAAYDTVRRKYLTTLANKTKRNTILYATKWTQPGTVDPRFITISEEDMQGFMEVVHGTSGDNLDLILHTPGGSPEATAAIVSYLRSKFNNIRVIVPHAAMSAGTMLACASDQIIMGRHSFLGPIDPQIQLQTPLGFRSVPAQAVLDQFNQAKKECENPKNLSSWLPILNQYGPTLLVESQNALDLSRKLVSEWLEIYMFKGQDGAKDLSNEIAEKLA